MKIFIQDLSFYITIIIYVLILWIYSSSRTEPVVTKDRNLIQITVDAFEPWNRSETPFPCVTDSKDSKDGIYFIKVPRTSHIGASVTYRIARFEERLNLPRRCKINDANKPIKALDQKLWTRNKTKTFLWSMLESPEIRAIKRFDLMVRTKRAEATIEAFVNDTSITPYIPNTQLAFLSIDTRISGFDSIEHYASLVKNVLAEYNFIGIDERLHESLVALSMLIDIDIGHVIYEFTNCAFTNYAANNLRRYITPEMDSYLKSKKWKTRQSGDYLLYNAVNKALDLTIASLDSEEFNARLKKIDQWNKASVIVKGKHGCGVVLNRKFPEELGELSEILSARAK